MTEFVYKLNLPPLTEILLDSAKTELFNAKNNAEHSHLEKLSYYLKPEWLTFNGITWNFVSFFYKSNYTGLIHIDEQTRVHQLHERANWGINWIHGGSGIMEYWLPEDIIFSIPQEDETGNYKRIQCSTTKAPYRTYNMSPGAYLVNASVPHRATGYTGRYAFSVRDNCEKNIMTWNAVVDLFKDHIIN
jgi:hypothetical protein